MLCMEWTVHVYYACGHPLHKVTVHLQCTKSLSIYSAVQWKRGVDDDDDCYYYGKRLRLRERENNKREQPGGTTSAQLRGQTRDAGLSKPVPIGT